MKRFILLILVALGLFASGQKSRYTEPYRPRFHFSPAFNWTNDPNGLVYAKGQYHLFYQYNPLGNVWGHMSWGHAISLDLIHWKHLPLAIPEENGTMIFSGSAVIDKYNSSGLGKKTGIGPMVAIYTGHFIKDSTHPGDYLQSQNIAYSLDDGITWKKYKHNPVLDLDQKDFRDPAVFWFGPGKKWIMAVVMPRKHIVQFYGSPNLINWTHLSDFGPAGDTADVWECPDLLQVPVAGSATKRKWVLFTSQQTTMQYFVGEFDGIKFVNENPASIIYRPDQGPDYYAAITYNHLPAGQRPVLLGWANNWKYANDIPTQPWKGMMALPRQLVLKKTGNAWILYQQPVSSIYALRAAPWQATNWHIENEKSLPVRSQQCEILVAWRPAANTISGVRLAAGKNAGLVIGYDAKEEKLFMDRADAGKRSFNRDFETLSHYDTKLSAAGKPLRLHIFFDHSLVEVFANDGEAVMTMQIFPDKTDDKIELYSTGGVNVFDSIKLWNLRSAWP